ncbi:transglutaminaseTgpA domain-containing protein [Nonomuraea ferruginea]
MRLSIAAAVATFTAAILLYPLFEGGAWFWGSLGAVLSVMLASLVSGRLSLPSWAAPLLGVGVLFVYLTVSFAAEEAWALFVPTEDSVVEVARLLATGWADIQRYAAPVPANEAITLLTTGGVGLIAIVVDLFATRLRKAALAGLPLLALATVLATILSDPISWLGVHRGRVRVHRPAPRGRPRAGRPVGPGGAGAPDPDDGGGAAAGQAGPRRVRRHERAAPVGQAHRVRRHRAGRAGAEPCC